MNQKIESLSKAEELWVHVNLENARKFVEAFSPIDAKNPLTLSALDRAFASWLNSEQDHDIALVNQIINFVGIAFGKVLVEYLHFEWVIATDDQGTDLAVYGLPERGDMLIFPANFVAKRWERREAGFLEQSYSEIASEIRRLVD